MIQGVPDGNREPRATISVVMAGMPLGRDEELAAVDRFLAGVPEGVRALALTGPAGIGKTTLWREGVRRARGLGYAVLEARPNQAERKLSFGGLADLLRGIDLSSVVGLAAPARRALEVAVLRAEAGEAPVDALAVATGMLRLLEHLAARRPILVAVDDAQWLDGASDDALSYAIRRLDGTAAGVLVSVRVEGERPSTFEAAVPAGRRGDVQLAPLSAAALHAILKQELDVAFPRPTMVRIVAACGGNPFYAVEIARELLRSGATSPGARLPIPAELRDLVRTRIARLPAPTRRALLVASCLSHPTAEEVAVEDLQPAERAGVVRVDEAGRVQFVHPLLSSAVYESASASERRAIHSGLAASLREPEARAWHLASAATAPDEAVAAALEDAASRAGGRGATGLACELARRALELTVDRDSEAGVRRAIAAADYMSDTAQNPADTQAILERAMERCQDPELRGEMLLRIAIACREQDRLEAGYQALLDGLAVARGRELRARLHKEAVWLTDHDPARSISHCDAALELVDESMNPVLYSTILLHRAYLRLISGLGPDDEAVARGSRLQAPGRDSSPVPLAWPVLKDDFEAGRAGYERAIADCRLIGDDSSLGALLCHLSELELLAGRWDRAGHLASQALDMVERLGSTAYLGTAIYARGMVDAHLGRVDAARQAGERIMALYPRSNLRLRGHWILGFLALSLGDGEEAAVRLTSAVEILDAKGEVEPARFRIHPDLIEAVIATGDLDRAATLLDGLDRRARVFPRPWILATSARCRALLLAARGDQAGAVEALSASLDRHRALAMPFELARTELAGGRILRRAGRRRESRDALLRALEGFARLGASLWAAQAEKETARIPIRRAAAGLTPTEEKIALLAASGLTNREVAERAFVSAKTVEANLARVYGKLGLRSRAELGRVMAERARSKT